MRHLLLAIIFSPLFAWAQAPVTPHEIDWLVKNTEIDLRFKRADGRTMKLQTIGFSSFPRYGQFLQPCWNKVACPEIASITARVFVKAANGDRLNRTRDSRLCAATECTLPAFKPIAFKTGEGIFLDYDRVTGTWRTQPAAVKYVVTATGLWFLHPNGHPFLNYKDTGGSGAVDLVAKGETVYFKSSDGKWWEWRGTNGNWFGPVPAP